MYIFFIRALFTLKGKTESKSGYVLAETMAEAIAFAGDKIRTYGKVDIFHMEGHRRSENQKAAEAAKEQPADHWDKLYSFKSKI